MKITLPLVHKLITTQFPEFSHLEITSVKAQGHDNRTFRLGTDMLVRIPTAKSYALKVPKEQKFLPLLKPYLTTAIPSPIKMGYPSSDFPFNFSIYTWLYGESANNIILPDNDLEVIALDLAKFLKELQNIDSIGVLKPGLHNFYRGSHISIYNQEARDQIKALDGIINIDKAFKLWDKAVNTNWTKLPVWIHGDFAAGNILIQNQRLTGVIDFGGMGVGDPACDLVIAWTLLRGTSRKLFKDHLMIDDDTWTRAKAWALWKATYELCNTINTTDHVKQKQIIEDILAETI